MSRKLVVDLAVYSFEPSYERRCTPNQELFALVEPLVVALIKGGGPGANPPAQEWLLDFIGTQNAFDQSYLPAIRALQPALRPVGGPGPDVVQPWREQRTACQPLTVAALNSHGYESYAWRKEDIDRLSSQPNTVPLTWRGVPVLGARLDSQEALEELVAQSLEIQASPSLEPAGKSKGLPLKVGCGYPNKADPGTDVGIMDGKV